MKKISIDTVDIVNLVLTKSDGENLCDEISQLLPLLRDSDTFQSVLEQVFSYQRMGEITTLLKKYQLSPKDISAVNAFFQELYSTINQLPQMSLTIAFPPSSQFLRMISSWIILNLKKPVLIDVTVDTGLAGGAIIEMNGNYKDYSLKKRLQELYAQGNVRVRNL